MICSREEVDTNGLMGECMMVCGKEAKWMDKDNFVGPMVAHMKGNI